MEYPSGATPLDADELAGLKHAHVETRRELDALEQRNIQSGLRWLQRQRRFGDEELLTEAFARLLHKKLFGEVWRWAGTFRTTERNIGIDPILISIELRHLLDDARFWVNHQTFNGQEFAARFHHRLVSIHPFPNGNGRFARIMTDVIVERAPGLPTPNWGGGNLADDDVHRRLYIDALRRADDGDYQPLIKFLARSVQE